MNDGDDKKRAALITACKRAIDMAGRAEIATVAIAEELRNALDAGNDGTGEMRVEPVRDSTTRAFRDLQARFENPGPTACCRDASLLGFGDGLTMPITTLSRPTPWA